MTALALRPDNSPALIPDAAAGLVEWAHAAQAAHTLATSLVKTSFVPQKYRNKPDEAAVAMLAGAELGLSPLASLRAFDDIQGTAAPKAITLRAVAQAHGHEVEITEESDVRAVARYRRAGSSDWQTVEWTIEQARGLGLTGKDNWKKQPKSMLVARATSEASRRVASDAILGIPYSSEELQDSLPEPTAKVSRSTTSRPVQRRQPPPTPEPDFDEPPAPAEPAKVEAERADEPLRSEAQSTAIHAGLTALNIKDRDEGLAFISQIVGAEIASTKELTKSQASRVIEYIKAEQEAIERGEAAPTATIPGTES
jgi:hypothetical protein